MKAENMESELRVLSAQAKDRRIAFELSRLAGELEMLRGFRKSGQFREAKYTATFLTKNLDALDEGVSSAHAVLVAALRSCAEEALRLPDAFDVIDRSARIIARQNEPPGPEKFPAGSLVRIAPLAALQTFKDTWKLHHPLVDEQLQYAGKIARVRNVGYYHGGDILYILDEMDDYTWHEQCLESACDDNPS